MPAPIKPTRHLAIAGFAAAVAAALAAPVMADDIAAFYSGRTMELIVGYPPAGSNDIFGRILAQHLPRHIPGRPTMIVRNMPGGGSLVAANFVFARAPRDGSAIAGVSAGMPLQARLGVPHARFEPSKLGWIGRIQSSSSVTMVWHTTRFKTFADARREEIKLGATGAGSTGALYPGVMNEVLRTRFKLIMGYKGTHEAMLAMERGEVEGHSTTWDAVKSVNMRWVQEGLVRILVQHGLNRAPDLPNVPTSVELADAGEDRAVMRAIMGAAEIGKSYFTPPEVPAARVQALRRAFDAVMKDAQFIADVKKVHGEVEPMTGEAVQALIGELEAFPQAVIDRVKAIYKE